jgi:hypothetical protein
MTVDPLASMRCWAIELELGGRTFDVPALPAVDWWPVISSGDLTQILDFVVSTPGDPNSLDEMILREGLGSDLTEVLSDAVEAAAGRTFHAARVLAIVAESQWASINGAMVARGFRWDLQPLGAALDAIYAEVISRLDKEALTKFLAVLENEALTKGGRKAKVSEKVVEEFEGFAGPRPTSGVKSTGGPSDNARPKTRRRPRPPRQGDPSPEPTRPRASRAGSGPAASS